MLTPANFYPYQRRGIEHMLAHFYAMVWVFMGGGKTPMSLTVLAELLDRWEIHGALVLAPLRIIQSVWMQEARKWSHLQHLTFSLVHGTAIERETALRRHAQIYLCNYEGLSWLATKVEQLWLRHGKYPPFNALVLDEVTKVKNSQANRTQALQRLLPYFARRIGLTGEPAANGYKDLYGQYLCVDEGQRLGRSLTAFRETYLRPSGFGNYDWTATRTGRERIHKRIADITLEMTDSEYLDLPPVTYYTVHVDLPPAARKVYDEMEKEFFAELDSGNVLEVMNEAGKLTKLLQIASGAAYLVVGGDWEEIHKAKLEALQDAVEEASGRPLLVGYTFIHEAERIAQMFPERPQTGSGASFLSSKLGGAALDALLTRWSQDQVQLLCAHPASAGHGLNLQGSSANSIVWFSLPWSLELYKQMNARLIGGHRRKGESFVYHIVARDTVDELVLATLEAKDTTQEGLKRAIKEYREKRGL